MRTFSSYGPVNKHLHYYAPRKALICQAYEQLVGRHPEYGGHYVTIWAPRQTGKTWMMQQVYENIKKNDKFDTALLTMEFARNASDPKEAISLFVSQLSDSLGRDFPEIHSWERLADIFKNTCLTKPLILILDEFDALKEEFINQLAGVFRSVYTARCNEPDNKTYLLHGLALIGVRSVLGIGQKSGSPFNVQRSVHIPNLSREETRSLFKWYEDDSGQKIEPKVVDRLFDETRGHPGLICWFGELLTETYNADSTRPISMKQFDIAHSAAVKILPNNTILNIVGKADKAPYRQAALDLFRTERKTEFSYDDKLLNYLYLNGVIDWETENDTNYYVRFACPFVQKRLFNYFARNLFGYMGKLHEPFEDLSDAASKDQLNIVNLMRRFQAHLKKNREWLLEDAPRRKDMRIFEAVFHFNLYRFLCDFLETRQAKVWPEFPAGNGAVDILIKYAGRLYALELKSYTDKAGFGKALDQAAKYGKQLALLEISLVFFVEYIDEANREKYEQRYPNAETGVTVSAIFVETGN